MMNKTFATLFSALFLFQCCTAQEIRITDTLYATYPTFREDRIAMRRIKHATLQPLIEEYAKNPKFDVNQVGTSIEGRSLKLISIGQGDTDVFLWSQMHGDEPTATQAIFDILKFLSSEDFAVEKHQILSKLRLHFLPMLNPDGAEVFQRRNLLGIDVNRDALRLQSPEGQTLKRVRDSLEADFGFNLHDQSIYYNAERTDKPATISYLAPAYNYEKEINESRGDAMKVIVFMNNIIQQYAPGQVGRYNDDFEPRAFGDNIQKWGTRTILIESGGYKDDIEKQVIRKLNYVSILSAIYTIARGDYKDIALEDYEKIPENDRKLFDLKITALTYNLMGKPYILDLGIQRLEIDRAQHKEFWNKSIIADQGDLSTYYGYHTFDAAGYTARPPDIYPTTLHSFDELEKLDAAELLRTGYAYVRVEAIPSGTDSTGVPLNVLYQDHKMPSFRLDVGVNPTFLLEKEGKIRYAVVNGFLIDLDGENKMFANGLIYK